MSTEYWFTYIAKCGDGSFYTGITPNLRSRRKSHMDGKGSDWTTLRPPVFLRYAEKFADKSSATRREIQIKEFRREKKIALINSDKNLIRTKRIKD